jgi:hypothetical protein
MILERILISVKQMNINPGIFSDVSREKQGKAGIR